MIGSIINYFNSGDTSLNPQEEKNHSGKPRQNQQTNASQRLDQANWAPAFRESSGLLDRELFSNSASQNNRLLSSMREGHDLLNLQISQRGASSSNSALGGAMQIGSEWNRDQKVQLSNYTPSSNATAESIAQSAEHAAKSMNSSGLCYRGVKKGLAKNGVHLTGGSAYMAAPQLARDERFIEVAPGNIRRGDVIVHNRSGGKEHGHIAVALGHGKEASDQVINLVSGRAYGGTRVFRAKAPSDTSASDIA